MLGQQDMECSRLVPYVCGAEAVNIPGTYCLGVESPMNGMRTLRASLKRLWKPPLVEDVDGIAGGLGVAPEVAGDLVGVLVPGAGEKYLATA